MIAGTSARFGAEVARQSGLATDIARLQDQVSTQKRLGAPSDDPAGAARVGAIRQVQADDAAYLANTNIAAAVATRADSAMASLSASLDRATELLTRAASGTDNADGRAAAAVELRSLATDIGQLANTRDSRGVALFPDGEPLAVPIAPGVAVAPTVSRAALFGTTGTDGQPTDIAAMLAAAADAVGGVNGQAGASAALAAVTRTAAQVVQVRTDHGLRAARVDARADAIADTATSLKIERSGIEDTDIAAAISLITSKMTSLQAAQAVFAKINRQTLFDVLG